MALLLKMPLVPPSHREGYKASLTRHYSTTENLFFGFDACMVVLLYRVIRSASASVVRTCLIFKARRISSRSRYDRPGVLPTILA
jgi:hypothetical protein